MSKSKKAFTLIELLVVIAIIGILATISVLALSNARSKSRDAKRAGDVKQIQTALELFFNDNNRYPTTEEWNTGKIYSTSTGATSTYMQVIPNAPTPADGTCTDTKNTINYTPSSDWGSYSISFCLGNTTGTLTPGPKCLTPGGIIDVDCSPVAAPSALSYTIPSAGLFVAGTAISSLTPVVSGVVDSYSILPALPIGLLFNASNGQITGTPVAAMNQTTYTITATNSSGSVSFDLALSVYGTVTGVSGGVWLDRNLGATQVAISSTDSAAYGDLYQWGRAADGHQIRTSNAIASLSPTDTPGHDSFIININSPYDWRSTQNDNLWQGVNGINNPCPAGFRIPTETELNTEASNWSPPMYVSSAFASPLKLTVAGDRGMTFGSSSVSEVGVLGVYWSSTVNGTGSRGLYFFGGGRYMADTPRTTAFSVRCIKD
ncbi:MAG: prepilin-type N-terminal cleavage/methylation domain-containing protein [Candidatus Falkowbacteria bacterium]